MELWRLPATHLKYWANPLPAHTAGPSNSTINMIFVEGFSLDLSLIISPPKTSVQVRLTKDNSPLVAPINYSPSNALVSGGPTPINYNLLHEAWHILPYTLHHNQRRSQL